MNRVACRHKNGYSNYNPFIVNFPRDEFMVDIAEMDYLNGAYKYLFVCIDIISNYAYGTKMPNQK